MTNKTHTSMAKLHNSPLLTGLLTGLLLAAGGPAGSSPSLATEPAAAPRADDEDPRLEEARRLLGGEGEGEVNAGRDLCVAMNNQAAADLLLEHLGNMTHNRGLAPGHYRDIAWEGLLLITDHYARLRVETELRKNKQNGWSRMWSAELLGIYGEKDWGPALVGALKDKDIWVKRAAARSLGMIEGFDEAQKPLLKLAKHKDDRLRSNVLESLARIDPAKHGEAFRDAIASDRDGGVRCALLGASREVLPDEYEALSAAALTDEDWRPRLQAVDNLGVTKTKTAIDRLIEAIEDGRPTVGLRAVQNLQELTHQPHTRAKAWQNWWRDNRATFEFPEGDAAKSAPDTEGDTVAVYNGMRVTSDHVAFLMDRSAAMREHLNSKSMSKLDASQQQLEEVLTSLPDGLVFNVFTYELGVEAFSKKPVELNAKQAKKALAFVDDQSLRGAKDIWQVLEAVVADPTLDTIYLLSSGEPDTGTYVHWMRVTRHLADLNRFHKVTVHTVSYSDNKWYRDQLEKIAEVTGGEFKWFE
ncbi:MAG: HEAT repeat domain-containing protein [Planctomycetota bacterium]|nr:HEAT repeat domain-containing protein [Planctomycetota bacterium]